MRACGRRRSGREESRAPAAAAALALAAGLACAPEAAPRPNLLLVTVDTLRPDRLGCYGGEDGVGSAICSLADRGTRFTWAFAPAPSTAPSIASLLTSRHPGEHGVTQRADTVLRDEAVTVAEILGEAGYATAAFVSNPVLGRPRNLHQGFDVYDAQMTRRERNRMLREREARATTEAALAWVRVARSPWFLWVHYQDPHGPYDPPVSGRTRDDRGGRRLEVLDDHSGRGGIPAYQFLGPNSFDAYAGRYVKEIRYLDLHLGLLLAGLEERGEPLFAVLTADHGEAFGEDDYYFAHGHSVGLDQIRVPLLVRPVEPSPPRVWTGAVTTLDVAPTLLRAAGLPLPAGLRGRPLPLDGDAPAPGGERALFAEHRARAAVIRGDTYYARDRDGFAEPRPDEITGGTLWPLPTRSARLGREGDLPGYADESPAALEDLLAEHLAGLPAGPAAEGVPLDDEERAALRALGYLE